MKLLAPALILFTALSAFPARSQKAPQPTKHNSYSPGEELEYRVHFGLFTVGKASAKVDKIFHKNGSKTCFKVDAFGETSDWISWVAKVDDNWGAYVDTATLNTVVSYRKLAEGKYRRDEEVVFDQVNHKADVRVKNRDTGQIESKVYDIPKNTKDIVAGFLYLRAIDFKKVGVGDTVTISGFHENASYNLQIIYTGKEILKTKMGKIQCLRLRPVMPANSLFDGEDSILCWISDDLNRIPIKLQAKMFIGNTGLELISFRALRNPLKIIF